MNKKLLLLTTFALFVSTLSAQLSRLDVEVRGDWQYENLKGETLPATSGFEGKFLNFRMDGSLLEGLTYSIR